MDVASIKAIISMTFSGDKLGAHSYFRVILFICLCEDSNVQEYFVYMHACAPCACLMPVEARGG